MMRRELHGQVAPAPTPTPGLAPLTLPTPRAAGVLCHKPVVGGQDTAAAPAAQCAGGQHGRQGVLPGCSWPAALTPGLPGVPEGLRNPDHSVPRRRVGSRRCHVPVPACCRALQHPSTPVACTPVCLQAAGVPYKGLLDCLVQIARHEGLRGLYKGLLPSLLLVRPGPGGEWGGHADAHFVVPAGPRTSRRRPSNPASEPRACHRLHGPMVGVGTGAGTSGPPPPPLFHPAPLLRQVSHGAIQFAVYEELKTLVNTRWRRDRSLSGGSPSRSAIRRFRPTASEAATPLSPLEAMACGALSKIVASVATYPSQVGRRAALACSRGSFAARTDCVGAHGRTRCAWSAGWLAVAAPLFGPAVRHPHAASCTCSPSTLPSLGLMLALLPTTGPPIVPHPTTR